MTIGVIQINLDYRLAWRDKDNKLLSKMNSYGEEIVRDELIKAINYFIESNAKPHIILLPEYTMSPSLEYLILELIKNLGCLVCCGCDLFEVSEKSVINRGKFFVPFSWPNIEASKNSSITGPSYYFGKKYYSIEEKKWFKEINAKEISDDKIYIYDSGHLGTIGVVICADFYDLERFVLYKGKIHHLFIIAYNKDSTSFSALTESISRLLMCNVVICNTGLYGDSLAFSPYKNHAKRNIVKFTGNDLFLNQVFKLPLKQLDYEQTLAGQIITKENLPPDIENKKNIFKLPPGFVKHKIEWSLIEKSEDQ